MSALSDLADELDDHGRQACSLSTEVAGGEVAPVDIRKRIVQMASHLESISADAAKL